MGNSVARPMDAMRATIASFKRYLFEGKEGERKRSAACVKGARRAKGRTQAPPRKRLNSALCRGRRRRRRERVRGLRYRGIALSAIAWRESPVLLVCLGRCPWPRVGVDSGDECGTG